MDKHEAAAIMADTNPQNLTLRTPAWIKTGKLFWDAGFLILDKYRVRYEGTRGPVFDAPLAEIHGVKLSWIGLGSMLSMMVSGRKYTVTFAQPRGAPSPQAQLTGLVAGATVGRLVGSAADLGDAAAARRAGKAWKRILTGLSGSAS